MNNSAISQITGSSLLKRNILWNFIAQLLPLLVAFFTIPMIIKGMGTAKFSVLTLVWVVIGYSSLFDLGLGRALTQLVAKKLGADDTDDLPKTIWTAFFIIFILGILGTGVLCLLTPMIVTQFFILPKELISETINSMYLLALTLPLLVIIMCAKGVLEAYQKFAIVSFLRIPVIIFNYIGPLAVIPFTGSLTVVVAVLVIGRIITFIGHLWACAWVIKDFFKHIGIEKSSIKPLLSFGGWITVSNIIFPIMNYMDRFFIAGIVSATLIAYYATPYDILLNLLIIPRAIIGVMFPAFSAEFSRDIGKTRRLYFKSIKYVILLLSIPVIIIFLFAKFGLGIWINPEFASHSYKITRLLAIAMLIEGINFVPYSLIQATGRSDITAKAHMVELPVYLFFLWFFINSFGLIGAVFAFIIRASLDTIILYVISLKLLKE